MATSAAALRRSIPRLRSLLLLPCVPPNPIPSSPVIPNAFHAPPWASSFHIRHSLPWTGIIRSTVITQISIDQPYQKDLTVTGMRVQCPPSMLSRHISSSESKSDSKGSSSDAEVLNKTKGAQELRTSSFRELMSSVATAPIIPMILGVAGALPFLALTPPFPSFLPLPEVLSANPIEAQAAYGAVILSFLGGPHWGLAMVGINAFPNHKIFNFTINSLRYVWSVVPPLLAWPALLMATVPKFQVLICSFGLALAVDMFFAGHGLTPPWYLPLRLLLSGIAILCLTSSMIEVLLMQKMESKKARSPPE